MHTLICPDTSAVAEQAAEDSIAILQRAISEYGAAVWVLAGGTSPLLAYKIITATYADIVDWSKVTMIMGDERCVPVDHEDSNWGQITKALFSNKRLNAARQLVPKPELGADKAAKEYSQQIRQHVAWRNGEYAIDLLWLGVGEDGHTLSLFPGNPALQDGDDIIIPVYNSPKPPAERISLSMRAAVNVRQIIIFATGENKYHALCTVQKDPHALPIGLVADTASKLGHNVTWLYDRAASEGPL